MAMEIERRQFEIHAKKEKYEDVKEVEFDGYINEDDIFAALTGFELYYDGGETYTINKVMADTRIDDTREKSATVKVSADFANLEGHPGPDDVFSGQVSVVVVAETNS